MNKLKRLRAAGLAVIPAVFGTATPGGSALTTASPGGSALAAATASGSTTTTATAGGRP